MQDSLWVPGLPTTRALTKKPVSGFQHVVYLNILAGFELGSKRYLWDRRSLGSGALEVTLLLDLGLSLVVPRDFFQMIQQWVPSLNNDVLNEKGSARLQLLRMRAFYQVSSLSFRLPLARAQLWRILVSLSTLSFLFELWFLSASQRSRELL